MPRPGNLIEEGFEKKIDCVDSLKSLEFCDTKALIYRMNSFNNEKTVLFEKPEEKKDRSSVSDMEISDEENAESPVPKGRGRRMALADIFENVNENDMIRLLSVYVKKEISQLVNEKRLCRRGGKSDIFEGLTESEIKEVLEHSCCQENCSMDDEVEPEISSEMTMALKKRRGGKCDIFEGLTIEQQKEIVNKFYKDYVESENKCDITCESEPKETHCCASEHRRGGKFYIFDGLSDEERIHVINLCIETCCKDMQKLQVGYGR